MSEEAGFLTHLAANPGDDVTRLVYADWLEERGDERGAYLRAEQELASMSENDARHDELDRTLSEQAQALPAEWLEAAGMRWDVWLIDYPLTAKIPVIKVLREVTGCGLAEGKMMSESLPAPVVVKRSRSGAEAVRAKLREAKAYYYDPPSYPQDAPPVRVALRPWTELSDEWVCQLPPTYQVVITAHPLRRKTAAIEALSGEFHVPPATARSWIENSLPVTLGRYPTEEAAATVVERLGDAVVAAVSRYDPPPIVRRPPNFTPVPRSTSVGPYSVRLSSYPRERKIAVIKAIRELTGMGLAEAKAFSEQPFPITLREGCDREGAERFAARFAEFGQVEVVPTTSEG